VKSRFLLPLLAAILLAPLTLKAQQAQPSTCTTGTFATGITPSGNAICVSASGANLQTNGTNNANQGTLNLVSGGGVAFTNTSGGTVTGTASYSLRTVSGTTDTILSTDCANGVQYTSSSAVAVTLPQGTGSFAACSVDVIAAGTGTVTVTPTTSTINGGASIAITGSRSANITASSGNYVAAGNYQSNVLSTVPLSGGAAGALSVNVNGYIGGQGSQNVCTQSGTPCNADTLWTNQASLTLSGSSTAVLTNIVDPVTSSQLVIPSSYVGAVATVTGGGPLQAQGSVGGLGMTAEGSAYTADIGGGFVGGANGSGVANTVGDYIVVSGGTPVDGNTNITASIAQATGIMTVTNCGGGQIYPGELLTWAGSTGVTFVQDFISGQGFGTGCAGTYQTTYTNASNLASTTITGTNRAILRVLSLAGPITAAGVQSGGTGTAGGPYTSISLTNISGYSNGAGSGAVGTITMGGTGGTHVISVAITTAGTGYAVGDQLSCGTIPGGTGGTGTNACVVQVSAVNTSGGAIGYVGVVAGGHYSATPSNPVTQLSTNGAGSGATVALTYAGRPISGLITAVGTGTITINTPVTTTYSSKAEQLAFGHPDDAAVQAALAKNPVGLDFPETLAPSWVSIPLGYGFSGSPSVNPITISNAYRFTLQCGGARLIALAQMNAMMIVPWNANTSSFFKPSVDNCEVQAMGLANYGAYLSAARYTLHKSAIENAVVEDVFVGDGNGDAAANVVMDDVTLHTDTNAVPQWPIYNYEQQASNDNQVCLMNADSAIWANMYVGGADDQIGCKSHVFAVSAGVGIDIEATKTGIDALVDQPAPGQAGYYVNSSLANIAWWQESLANTYAGQYGVYLAKDQTSFVGCGIGANAQAWSFNPGNLVYSPGGVANLVTTTIANCTGNGLSPPPLSVGNLTVSGTCTGCGASGAAYTYTGTANYTVSDGNGKLFQASDPGATSNNYVVLQPGAVGTAAGISVLNVSGATTAADLGFAVSAKNAAASSGLAGGNTTQNAGNGDGAAAGGNVNLNGGNGGATGAGGNINITAGASSSSAAGGTVTIKGGTSSSGTVGPVNINNQASAGVVNIMTGASGTSATHIADGGVTGNIILGASGNQTNINSGWVGFNSIKWEQVGTAPTPTAGNALGTGPAISPAFASTKAFGITVGTGPTGTAVGITALGTLAGGHFWDCQAWDRTTPTITGNTTSAVSTTSVTITLSATPTAGDQLVIKCDGI
jgi:hypothetical protein